METKESVNITGLTYEKRELLAYLIEDEGVNLLPSERITRRPNLDEPPLSFAQQRLWFLDQFGVRGLVYNIASGFRFRGPLNISVLNRCVSEISRRHEILRTVFHSLEGRAFQVILPARDITLPIIDLSDLSIEEREICTRKLAREEAEQSFQLANGPLYRLKVVKEGQEEHVLLLTMHHIISDAWSMGVLVREMAALYEAFTQEEPSPLEELPIQYADYAYWQRWRLESEAARRQIEYWKEQLRDGEFTLELPVDRPRPAVQSYRGAVEVFELARQVCEGLRRLSRERGVTLYMALLGAFYALLSRYSGQKDISIGSPIAGRNRGEIEGLIGIFVNTLVMRVKGEAGDSFEGLLMKVREVAIGAYANEEAPFERIVEEVGVERDLSRSPLFQVMFALQNTPLRTFTVTRLSIESLPYESGSAKFDLNLAMEELSGKLYGSIEYRTDLYDASTIKRLINHYKNLLEGILADPEEAIDRLPLLSKQELEQILYEWNDTSAIYKPELRIHNLFERQVEQSPESIALSFDDQALSYGELNSAANRLAHLLIESGASPESLIGICLHRSVEMIVGLLAILKSGAAYVPLDPSYPKPRLDYMISDAGVQVLLTQQKMAGQLTDSHAKVIELDRPWPDGSSYSEENPTVEIVGENLAYMIYTSGSTGLPKGALIPHQGIYNRLMWMQQQYRLTESDRVLQKTPFSFDVSVWEFFWPLMFGAKLVIARPEGHKDSEYLVDLIREQEVTILHFVPSMLQVILGQEGVSSCNSVRLVVSSGEALGAELQARFYERMSGTLVNLYGPTEASVDVTYWECKEGDERRAVPIGKPIANTEIYILDKSGEVVAPGVAGEIHIGGVGVGRGYHNRAPLTAEKFIPNNIGQRRGGVLYKSGDLGRYRMDGSIEYLRRLDEQVKLRGYRIELGEIESVIKQDHRIKEAVAVLRNDLPGGKRIAAYVEWEDPYSGSIDDLRTRLKGKMPDYMVPATITIINQWPLTPNGKLNKSALPAVGPERPDLREVYVAPRTLIEELLAGIWSQVLGIEPIGVHDNFFALGGDSIRSVQVMALAKERGVNFSLQQLFQHQTIANLSRETEFSRGIRPPASRTQPFGLVPQEDRSKLPDDVEDAYPLTILQMGMLYHMEMTPDSPVYHNINSYHLKAPFDATSFQEAVQKVVARHPILRTSFDLTSYNEPMQLVHEIARLDVFVEDLRHLSSDQQVEILSEFIDREKRNRFDFAKAPLMRFHFHRRSDETFQFSLTEYHAITDGWSLHANLAEIFDYYFTLLNNDSLPDASPLALTFREYVLLEREAVESEEARNYWDGQLADCTILELPRWSKKVQRDDRPKVRRLGVPISPEISDGLKQTARLLSVPIKSVLLAVHLKVLSALSGQGDIMTGLVFNGRPEERDGEMIRGLFLNTLPFRLKVSHGRWADLIRSAFETELEMLPFRRYPMALLQNKHGRESLFETLFNYTYFHVIDNLLESRKVEVLDNSFMSEETNFRLTTHFFLTPVLATVALDLDYDSTWFSDDQIKAVAGYYSVALSQVAHDAFQAHDANCLLSGAELEQLLVKWNDTREDISQHRRAQHLFEAQVELTPDAVAVAFENEQVTYAKLNRRSNQLAHYLREMGAGPDELIGICLERSLEMAIAVLAALKTGAAYVPLDPAYPKERLAFMLEDSKARLLVTQKGLEGLFTEGNVRTINLDCEWASISGKPEENPNSGVDADHLAYVIYTSGSTGKPKGIALPHRCLSQLIEWHFTAHSRSARTLQFASLSFDASFHEMFSAWRSGGLLFMIPNELRLDLGALAQFLYEACIEKITLPVVVLQQLSEEYAGRPEILSRLREVIATGEQLQITRPVINLFKSLPNNSLHNHYGPSETHVVTWHPLTDAAESWAPFPPIGRPISNSQIYLLDQNLNPVPLYVSGELYIGGVSLARGYFNQSGLTAEKFVPNPHANEPGERLYRTGDLARYQSDGNIEFLGRIDHQVKVRGFRVELGEIESVLSQHPNVLEVVVLAREDVAGGKRLVAYVVSDDHQASSGNQWRAYLAERLPAYMIPSAFILMERMPLTANGKIDRRSLPLPDRARAELTREFVPPRSAAEQVTAKIIATVLGIEQIGVFDNFFELGGHSMMATRVIFRLREAFRVDLPLPSLFDKPTVEGILEAITQIWGDRETVEEIAQAIQQVESLSEDEINKLIAEQEDSD